MKQFGDTPCCLSIYLKMNKPPIITISYRHMQKLLKCFLHRCDKTRCNGTYCVIISCPICLVAFHHCSFLRNSQIRFGFILIDTIAQWKTTCPIPGLTRTIHFRFRAMTVCVIVLVPILVKLFNKRNANLIDWYFFPCGGGRHFVGSCHEQFNESGRVSCKLCPVKVVLLDELKKNLVKTL